MFLGCTILGAAEPEPPRALSNATRVMVRRFRFEGNTVFSSNDLQRIVAPYTGREITSEELQEVRRAITLHYVKHGYINSGAVIPEQEVTNGIVTIRVIEGRMTEIKVTGNRWLREQYIQERLNLSARQPLNMNRLRDELELLRQNPNVRQINAELEPGALPGEARLSVHVLDEQPFRLGLQVDNARPPSVGAEEIMLITADRDLTGHSDPLEIDYGIAEGGYSQWKFSDFGNVGGSYSIPLTRFDTTLSAYGNRSDFAIIEGIFTNANITSDSYRIGGSLRQPFYQTSDGTLALAVAFERRYSETFVLGQPQSVSPGEVDGKEKLSAIRFSQEWVSQSIQQVMAVRSTFSFGIDALGVTDNGTARNAKFWAWLGEGQYVRRLGHTANQVILHAAGQWTDDQLLSLEQFSIGGANTVRGYRENELIRDRGFFASAELRVPLLYGKLGAPLVQLAPFFDFGGGWNTGGSPNLGSTPVTTLSSAGIGLLVSPNKHFTAQLYWGHPFQRIEAGHNDPQDLGLHFRVNFEAF